MLDTAVILRTKNNENTIADTIKSLIDNSKNYPFQLIIVDNSDDNTPQIAQQLLKDTDIDYIILRQEQAGLGYATHQGILNTYESIKYIITTDGDSILSPNLIKEAVKRLKEDNSIIAVGATSKSTKSIDEDLSALIFEQFTSEKLNKTPVGRFLAFRKDDYLKVRGLELDGIPAYYEDYIIVQKISLIPERNSFIILSEPVYTQIPSTTQIIALSKILSASLFALFLYQALIKKSKYAPLTLLASLTIYLLSQKRQISLREVDKLLESWIKRMTQRGE